jgi:hypothetical protein
MPTDVACGAGFSSRDFYVERVKDGASIRGPGMIVGLIRRACFFEGAVRYRVNPVHAVDVLNLGEDRSSGRGCCDPPHRDVAV